MWDDSRSVPAALGELVWEIEVCRHKSDLRTRRSTSCNVARELSVTLLVSKAHSGFVSKVATYEIVSPSGNNRSLLVFRPAKEVT